MLENRGLHIGQLARFDVVKDTVEAEGEAGRSEVLLVTVL